MSKRRISDAVSQGVFAPTAVAYFCMVFGYVRTGLVLYSAFIVVAYLVGWFRRITEWPIISIITLACGPPLLALGHFFSTRNTLTDHPLAPGFMYLVLSLVGGFALQRLD